MSGSMVEQMKDGGMGEEWMAWAREWVEEWRHGWVDGRLSRLMGGGMGDEWMAWWVEG